MKNTLSYWINILKGFRLHCTYGFFYNLAVGLRVRMIFFQMFDCIVYRVFLAQNQIESNHLRRSIDSCTTMHINFVLFHQILHHSHSTFCFIDEVLIIHILNRISFEFHTCFLAKKVEVIRRKTMAFVISLSLDWKYGSYSFFFKFLKVSQRFGIASYIDFGGDLRKFQSIEAALVLDTYFSFSRANHFSLRMGCILSIKIENSARFSLSFHSLSLSDVVITKLFFIILCPKTECINFCCILLLRMSILNYILFILAQTSTVNFFHNLRLLVSSKLLDIAHHIVPYLLLFSIPLVDVQVECDFLHIPPVI